MDDRQRLIKEIKTHTDTKKAKECIRLLKESSYSVGDIKAIWKGKIN